jgi:hypothetical protein
MLDPRESFDEKYVRRRCTLELVRILLEGSESAVERTRFAIESSRRRVPNHKLNLDTWPTGDRIRESF